MQEERYKEGALEKKGTGEKVEGRSARDESYKKQESGK